MSKSITLYPDPIDGVPIIEPVTLPLPGEVIVGYELLKKNDAFFHKPEPKRMNKYAWFSVIGLVICCWPCAFVPCVTNCSYDTVQRPVYGVAEDTTAPVDMTGIHSYPLSSQFEIDSIASGSPEEKEE